MMKAIQQMSVFAPATSANLAVGFDILGFAISGLGDELTLSLYDQPGLQLNIDSHQQPLPVDVKKNTATVALNAMLNGLGLKQGFVLDLKKKIPVSAGLGGSAASAVAAVVALNGFLKQPLPTADLLAFALTGEAAASGARHADNVVPCLYGGLQLIVSAEPAQVITLPTLPLYAVFIRPDCQVNTRDARKALKTTVSLKDVIKQTAHLAGFISALYEGDIQRVTDCCQDTLIEPQRAQFIPFFHEIKQVALQAGALACSISGSGPTLFALAESDNKAKEIGVAMSTAYKEREIDAEIFLSPLNAPGAQILETRT